MSSRQLRKLQQQRELEAQAKLQSQQVEESEEDIIPPMRQKQSLFANFATLQDEDEEEEELEDQLDVAESNDLSDPAPTSTKKSKKSKKKKGKKKAKNKSITEVDNEKGDEIDVALQQLALEQPSHSNDQAAERPVDPAYERVCELLGINTNHLKVGTEMRNLFGKNVMDNHDDAGGTVPRGARGNRRQRNAQQQVDLETALKGRHAPGKGLPEITLRRNIFVQGKDDWPRASSTLKLETSNSDWGRDETYGRYIHDKAYQDLQSNFHAFVEMGDPQNLIGLLQRNPYHISLLVQVSKVAKDQSDHSLSSDLLERALFTFARATNSIFATKISQGKMRLAFQRPENRELWLTGYQYIKSLIMKGTYRTALEWAKLLLSLDYIQDPYCMRLMIHHLAIRSSEFQWLLDLYESDFPNTWRPVGLQNSKADSHISPSLAFAALQLRNGVKARGLLTQSMTRVPWLFTRLFKELNLDAPPSIWGVQPRTDAETLFSEIYVLQTKDLWNTPEATALLMEIGHTIKETKVDDIPKLSNEEMTLDVVRFVYLDNNPALMRLVPSQLLHRENNSDSDPLPPYENKFSYEAQSRWVERGGNGRPGLGGDFMNPFAAIARMIPGFRAVPQGADDQDDVDDEVVDADQLRRGLEEVVRGNGVARARERGEQRMPRSVAQTLLEMLGWGSNDGVDDSDEDYEDVEDGTDTDYESIPGLGSMENSDDEDDEMPALINL